MFKGYQDCLYERIKDGYVPTVVAGMPFTSKSTYDELYHQKVRLSSRDVIRRIARIAE